MARFDILNSIKKASTINRELGVGTSSGIGTGFLGSVTAGNSRADSENGQWLEGRNQDQVADQRKPAFELDSVMARKAIEARAKNDEKLHAEFGFDPRGSYRATDPAELADVVNTCFRLDGLAQEHAGRRPDLTVKLNDLVAGLARQLPNVVGLRVGRSLMRGGIGALVRAAKVAPGQQQRLMALDFRGPAQSGEEQDRRDRLVDSVEEAINGLRIHMDAVNAVELASEEVGFFDQRGNRVKDLDRYHELVTSMVDLEVKSRIAMTKEQLLPYKDVKRNPDLKEVQDGIIARNKAKKAKLEAEGNALGRAVIDLVEMPKRVYRDRDVQLQPAGFRGGQHEAEIQARVRAAIRAVGTIGLPMPSGHYVPREEVVHTDPVGPVIRAVAAVELEVGADPQAAARAEWNWPRGLMDIVDGRWVPDYEGEAAAQKEIAEEAAAARAAAFAEMAAAVKVVNPSFDTMTIQDLTAAVKATGWTPELEAVQIRLLSAYAVKPAAVADPLSSTDRIMEEVAKTGWTPGLQHAYMRAVELEARG